MTKLKHNKLVFINIAKLAGNAVTERDHAQLCRDQDSNLGCLGHNEKY